MESRKWRQGNSCHWWFHLISGQKYVEKVQRVKEEDISQYSRCSKLTIFLNFHRLSHSLHRLSKHTFQKAPSSMMILINPRKTFKDFTLTGNHCQCIFWNNLCNYIVCMFYTENYLYLEILSLNHFLQLGSPTFLLLAKNNNSPTALSLWLSKLRLSGWI